MKKIFLACFVAVLFSSCSINVLNNMNSNVGTTFELLKQESYGGMEDESNLVIKTQQELNSLYNKLGIGTAPQIDFERNNVVALFMGQKNTGGYSISIGKISVTDDTTVIFAKRTVPPTGGVVSMALTAPYCIAVIPKTAETKFE